MAYRRDSIEGRFLAGETEAHAQVKRWIAQILTLPRFRLVRDEWTDLYQDTQRRILESLRQERFDASLDFRIYIQSIARYTARDAVVHKLRSLRRDDPLLEDVRAETDEQDLILTRQLVQRVMEAISDSCRTLFQLYFFKQKRYEEIAERMDIPVGTVKSRLFRCLQKAREKIPEPTTRRDTK